MVRGCRRLLLTRYSRIPSRALTLLDTLLRTEYSIIQSLCLRAFASPFCPRIHPPVSFGRGPHLVGGVRSTSEYSVLRIDRTVCTYSLGTRGYYSLHVLIHLRLFQTEHLPPKRPPSPAVSIHTYSVRSTSYIPTSSSSTHVLQPLSPFSLRSRWM